MTIDQTKQYFLARCNELISLAHRGDPWVFLCSSAMIEYLTKMTSGESGREAYIAFVNNYFKRVNSRYTTFQYQNGETDLPRQMYVILRCGIVHQFSFVPRQLEINNGGRIRSIILGHEMNGGIHLSAYTENEFDSAVFIAEQFSKDIKSVVELIFRDASDTQELETSILTFVNQYPPISSIS